MSRVLVVEPETAVRALVVEILAGAGHDAAAAETPTEAGRALSREPFDLVLADEGSVEELRAGGVAHVLGMARTVGASELLAAVEAALGSATLRVVVVEDHPAVRASLVAYLDAQDDIVVVGEAENGWEAVKLARQELPDFVLMDIRMPVMDGIEGTRMIKGLRPETRVLLLSAYEQDELIEAGTKAGADGFLLKGASGRELVAAVREAREGAR
jgi:DNA-binding NarL/FixJ family response regulator